MLVDITYLIGFSFHLFLLTEIHAPVTCPFISGSYEGQRDAEPNSAPPMQRCLCSINCGIVCLPIDKLVLFISTFQKEREGYRLDSNNYFIFCSFAFYSAFLISIRSLFQPTEIYIADVLTVSGYERESSPLNERIHADSLTIHASIYFSKRDLCC